MPTEVTIGIVLASIFGFLAFIFLVMVLLRFYIRRPTRGSDNPKTLHGKTVVITGANTGIGKVTATDLAKRGAKVIICCRSPERAQEAIKDIKNESGSQLVENVTCDLASLASVRKCAQTILGQEEKIDYLVNNAGVMWCPQWKTEDGFDMQIGTNHLGHFLLTQLLMPLIRKSAASGHHPRIVIVSSLGHTFVRHGFCFDDVHMDKGEYNTVMAYSQSKLANILHAKELAKQLEGTGISVYALHPGAIMTDLGRHLYERLGCWAKPLIPLVTFVVKTPFYGAQTTLYCLLEDKIEGQSGLYYSDCDVKAPSRHAQDMEAAKKLWQLSEELVGLKESV